MIEPSSVAVGQILSISEQDWLVVSATPRSLMLRNLRTGNFINLPLDDGKEDKRTPDAKIRFGETAIAVLRRGSDATQSKVESA